MKAYDYSKLRGKIREYYSTQEEFAKNLGISVNSLSNKLNNKQPFAQEEIDNSAVLLKVDNRSEAWTLFFTKQAD